MSLALAPIAALSRSFALSTPESSRTHAQQTHEVRMVSDANGYRFDPARVVIAPGDSIAFVVVSGQPHTVAFDTNAIRSDVARTLDGRMRDRIGTLSGPLLLSPGDRYAISFTRIPTGRYPFFCLPHLALRMTGEIVVQ